jgi:protein TonB
MAQPEKVTNPNSNTGHESDTTQQKKSIRAASILGLLVALILTASAIVYYQNEESAGPANAGPAGGASPTVSPGTASSRAETAQASPDSATAPESSATTTPTESVGESDTNLASKEKVVTNESSAPVKSVSRANGKPVKHQIAKASKPVRPIVLVPRERHAALAMTPHPTYPMKALRDHEQGTVRVLAQVDVNGDVTDTDVVGRSGWMILDRAASNEVRHWKFSPALHDGHPVVASVEVPVNYRLDQ